MAAPIKTSRSLPGWRECSRGGVCVKALRPARGGGCPALTQTAGPRRSVPDNAGSGPGVSTGAGSARLEANRNAPESLFPCRKCDEHREPA
jgi:hypothetical protein